LTLDRSHCQCSSKHEVFRSLFCPDALVALRTGRQTIGDGRSALRSPKGFVRHHQRQRYRIQNRIGTFILFDANQRICVLRPASRDMRTDVRSATSTRKVARRTRRLKQLSNP